MFLNILLVLLMVASLGGMLFCGKEHRNRPTLQLIALLLLVLVIVSGGMFMCRLGALSVLGVQDDSDLHLQLEQNCAVFKGLSLDFKPFYESRAVGIVAADFAVFFKNRVHAACLPGFFSQFVAKLCCLDFMRDCDIRTDTSFTF